ncbi:MAG: MarR family transcriptional regulator [Rhizobiales bacterium]|nr:MarR family transcriptional regulator [Hyphomicrobiales bacterium]
MLDTPLLLAHQAIRRLTAKALSTLGISVDEARVLEVLGGPERVSMGQVAAKSGLRISALSKLADRLEARGLARRVEGDDDTRRVYLVLTPLGERLRIQALAVIAKTDKHLTEKIGSWELDRLEKLLSKIQQQKSL